jgi:hypothetical protein
MSGLKDLVKLAGRLDSLGLEREADVLRAAFRKMAADGGSGTWEEGMPWSSSLGSDTSGGSEGMASGNAYPSKPAPTYGTHMDPEFAFARWVGSQDSVSKKTDKSAFEREFHRLWRMNKNSKGADPNNKYTPQQWTDLGLKFAPEVWESMQTRSVSTPKTAPSPKPRGPIRDWAYYNSKQTDEFGKGMEKFWFRNAPKLELEPDFNSFVRYYKKLAGIGGTERNRLSPREFIIFTINEIMNNTRVDSLVRYLADSKERMENQTVHNNLSIYLGYNPNTGKLSLDAEREEARGLLNNLKGIIEERVRNSAR